MSKNQVNPKAWNSKETSKQNCNIELNQAIKRPPTECVPRRARRNDEIYLSIIMDEEEQKYDRNRAQQNLASSDKNNGALSKNTAAVNATVTCQKLHSAKKCIATQNRAIEIQNDVKRPKDLVKDRVKERVPNASDRCTRPARLNEAISGKACRPKCEEPCVKNQVIAGSDDYQKLNSTSVPDISLYDVFSSSSIDKNKVAKSSDLLPRQPNLPARPNKEANFLRRPLIREQVCTSKQKH